MNYENIKFKHPTNTMVVGSTGSGKTVLVRNLLKYHKLLISVDTEILKVIWFYGQWHSLIDVNIDNCEIKYISNLPKDDVITKFKTNLIVIDDLLNEMNKEKNFENIFIKKSHHLNISVIFLVQNLFYNAKSMRTISLNCHYIILMKNPRDKTQIMTLARQIYPNDSKFLISAYTDATKESYGYIRIDLTQTTPDDLRVLSNLIPQDNNLPIIYVTKSTKNN